jgi:predicted nucleic acid-binding protein
MLHVVDASVVVKWFLPEPHRDKAMKLLVDFRNMSVDLRGPSPVGAALDFRPRKLHSPYDMLCVVLALQLGCEFVTADKTVVNKLSSQFPIIRC